MFAPVAVEYTNVELKEKTGVILAVSPVPVTVKLLDSVDVSALPDRGLSDTDLVSVPFVGTGTSLEVSVILVEEVTLGIGYTPVPNSVMFKKALEVVSAVPALGLSVIDLERVSAKVVAVSLAAELEFIDIMGDSEIKTLATAVVVSFIKVFVTETAVEFTDTVGAPEIDIIDSVGKRVEFSEKTGAPDCNRVLVSVGEIVEFIDNDGSSEGEEVTIPGITVVEFNEIDKYSDTNDDVAPVDEAVVFTDTDSPPEGIELGNVTGPVG